VSTYFSADLHIGHLNMTREGKDLCGRPFDTVVQMNEGLISNFNEVLTKEDRLILLGDTLMGKLDDSLMWLSYLNAGEIILVPGNHDKWSLGYHQKGDADAQARRREEARVKYEIDERFTALDDSKPSVWTGWMLGLGINHPLSETLFSHYPFDGDSHGEDRYSELRVKPYTKFPIIHGHVHTEWQIRGEQFNVGVDVNDFKPVHEDVLTDWVRSL
jgi:calcineurin-like phosphoesterase family protein